MTTEVSTVSKRETDFGRRFRMLAHFQKKKKRKKKKKKKKKKDLIGFVFSL